MKKTTLALCALATGLVVLPGAYLSAQSSEDSTTIAALETRVEALEALVEELQDDLADVQDRTEALENGDANTGEDDAEEEENNDDEDNDEVAGDGTGSIVLCHMPPGNPSKMHTIRVGVPAMQAHLGHGDHAGPCGSEDSEEDDEEDDVDQSEDEGDE